MTDTAWWRGAVIYQIYPLSFADSDGDGFGDLGGILERLDYLAGLHVDALWLSPIYLTPLKDYGYDVADFRAIDPRFGDLATFRRLLGAAHERGLKVILDFVPCHTSDLHAWFAESRAARGSAKADWYVWADPKPDGAPPNNWLSEFGGPAWTWDSRRRQYYLHHFHPGQPKLNHFNPEVTAAVLADAEYWLSLGVDGFRLDAINFCMHDPEFRDNPAAEQLHNPGPATPKGFQTNVHDVNHPEVLRILTEVRGLVDRYPGALALGEVGDSETLSVLADYIRGDDRLHTAYNFALLSGPPSTRHVRETVVEVQSLADGGWPCWSFGNHDTARSLSRWGGARPPDTLAKALNAALLSLRGTLCLYQGEELGLTEAKLDFEQLRDPLGLAFWPVIRGRDGCRTPMPWAAKKLHAGFSNGEPWLPVPDGHLDRAVDRQTADPGSVLNATRQFLAWRRAQPALIEGDIAFQDLPDPVLAFRRRGGGQRIFAAFNLGDGPARVPLDPEQPRRPLTGHGFEPPELDQDGLTLPAYGAAFLDLRSDTGGDHG